MAKYEKLRHCMKDSQSLVEVHEAHHHVLNYSDVGRVEEALCRIQTRRIHKFSHK